MYLMYPLTQDFAAHIPPRRSFFALQMAWCQKSFTRFANSASEGIPGRVLSEKLSFKSPIVSRMPSPLRKILKPLSKTPLVSGAKTSFLKCSVPKTAKSTSRSSPKMARLSFPPPTTDSSTKVIQQSPISPSHSE